MLARNEKNEPWRKLFDEARSQNDLGNRQRAEELFQLSIQEADKLSPDSRSFSSAQMCFALWYWAFNDFAKAEFFELRAIKAESRFVRGRELGNMMLCLADMQKSQGKLADAIETTEQAITLFPDRYELERSDAYRVLSQLLAEFGEPRAAEEALKKPLQ